MLLALHTLEFYFGFQSGGLFYEDLIKHFDLRDIHLALSNGDIDARKIEIGPDQGKTLIQLSPQGRTKIAFS